MRTASLYSGHTILSVQYSTQLAEVDHIASNPNTVHCIRQYYLVVVHKLSGVNDGQKFFLLIKKINKKKKKKKKKTPP